MKNLFDLFKKPVETKEEFKEVERLYCWKMTIVFNDQSKHTITTSSLTKKQSINLPEEMQKIISWYQNPEELAIKTFYFDNGSVSLDADNIMYIYANKYLE